MKNLQVLSLKNGYDGFTTITAVTPEGALITLGTNDAKLLPELCHAIDPTGMGLVFQATGQPRVIAHA